MVHMGDDGDIANRCRHEFNGVPAAKRNGLQVRSCGPSELQSRICGSYKRRPILARAATVYHLLAAGISWFRGRKKAPPLPGPERAGLWLSDPRSKASTRTAVSGRTASRAAWLRLM